jgi:hypothetical protein
MKRKKENGIEGMGKVEFGRAVMTLLSAGVTAFPTTIESADGCRYTCTVWLCTRVRAIARRSVVGDVGIYTWHVIYLRVRPWHDTRASVLALATISKPPARSYCPARAQDAPLSLPLATDETSIST